MAIRLRSTLKEWFKRGKYPLEEQFADWIDSFVHKTEDTLPLAHVKGLPAELNAKYDHASGVALERAHQTLRTAFDQHTAASTKEFRRIAGDIDDLQRMDDDLLRCIEVFDDRLRDIYGRDASQNDALAALQKADSDLQAEIDSGNVNREHLRKCLHPTADFGALESTFASLGAQYSSLWALCNTVRTFLEAKDVADSTINRWHEIELFLQGITDTTTLLGLLEARDRGITAAYKSAIAAAIEEEMNRARGAEAELQAQIGDERQRAEASEALLGERIVPLVMTVDAPRRITYGNAVKQYIRARLLPKFAAQNVLWLSDGKAVDVEPDGAVVVRGLGVSRVQVIPTENTALYQTVTIEVVMPSLLLQSGRAGLLLAGVNVLFT